MKNLLKKITALMVLMVFALGTAGCGSSKDSQNGNNSGSSSIAESGKTIYPVKITDSYGKEITLSKEPEKIISAAPNITEIIFKIGAEDKLVGRTNYCDYPESLREYLLRNVWPSTMKALRDEIYVSGFLDKPVFVKPRDNMKRFTGFICESVDDITQNAKGAGNGIKIWYSDVIHFTSEYRCPIVNGKLRGCYHYSNHNPYDYIKYREALFETVQKMADENKEGHSAYCLDVGITNKGEIALIEMTDGFSFGKYGMSDELLAEILITRWSELKNGR